MFCTLSLQESKKRFHKNLIIEECKIGDIEFLKIVVYKKTAVKKLEKKLKNKVDTVILSDNLKDLQFKKLKVYNNDAFIKSIAKYTFKNIMKLSKIPTNKLTICITDKECDFSDFVYSLATHATVIKIITDATEKYKDLSEKIYNDFGMLLILTSLAENADLGINFNTDNPRIWFNSPENFAELTKKCVKIGAGLRGYVPKGISECDFAGILRQYNDFRRLKLLHADVMVKNNKFYKINRENIKNFLDNKDECW